MAIPLPRPDPVLTPVLTMAMIHLNPTRTLQMQAPTLTHPTTIAMKSNRNIMDIQKGQ
jgi:hypothetical protein